MRQTESSGFNHELFRKVFYFEWVLLIISGLAQVLVLYFGKPDYTAPDLRVSLILLGVVGILSVLTPLKGSYWDRFCFLLLELMLITGATLAGLARFLFPVFVIVVAKSCLLLDRRGVLAVTFFAICSSLLWAGFKLYLQNPVILEHGFTPKAVTYIGTGAFLAIYVAIVLFILVVMLTQTQKAERESRLEAERLSKEIEQLATELERSRIAREIHDSLGHTLISLNIQLDIARRLQHLQPDKASEAIELAKELSGQLITDVRLAVQAIRNQANFNFEDAINELVNDVKQTQSMNIELKMDIQDVPKPVGYQVFRVIQECLTNVLKHANASEVTVHVNQSSDQLELVVSDNGCGLSSEKTVSGFGMKSMQERVQSMRGTVQVNAAPNKGTSIDVRIPLSLEVDHAGTT
jgi:signal transduction histidine kinase